MKTFRFKIQSVIFSLVLFFFAFLLFFKLGDNYLANWDEAWYADIIRNMATQGHFFKPIWNSNVFFDKPPLFYWISVIPFKIFTPEFSLRFVSAVFSLGTGILLYLLAKKIFSFKIAISSILILASSIGFLYRARTGNIDSLLSFMILASIYSYFKAEDNKKWYLVLGISVGLTYLTKGLIGFLIYPLIILYYYYNKNLKIISNKYFFQGLFLSIVIPLIWISISLFLNGQEFRDHYLLNQTGKFSTTIFFWNNFSFDFINFLKSGLKFWIIPFAPILFLSFLKFKKKNVIILPLYFIIFFGILMFSENKSNWFLMPLYPLVSLLTAWGIFEVGKFLKIKEGFLISFILLLSLITLVKFSTEYIVPDTVIDEVRIALKAKEISKKDEPIYLTNYYYPTTVFYSQRKTYALFGDKNSNDWWIKNKSEWSNILKKDKVIIISTSQELNELKGLYPSKKFEIIYQSGNKLLVESK